MITLRRWLYTGAACAGGYCIGRWSHSSHEPRWVLGIGILLLVSGVAMLLAQAIDSERRQ